MITNVDIKGYKSFLYHSIELRKLTLLTGLNSSGKSSVIQALRMLEKSCTDNHFLLDGHGGFKEIKNRSSKTFQIVAEKDDEWFEINESTKSENKGKEFPTVIYVAADRFGAETSWEVYNDNRKHLLGSKGENIFNCIRHYEDDILPQEVFHEDSEGDTFRYNLDAWLNIISPNVKFNYEVSDLSDSSFSTFNSFRSKNVGFGLSYTLPVIVALLMGTVIPNSIVLIENPEAHLHPKGQSELAKLVCKCVQGGAQVVIETHSDHLFNGVRVFTKEDKKNVFQNKVALHWFELDKDKNTQIESPLIDENGRLDEWPTNLFDQFEVNARKLL